MRTQGVVLAIAVSLTVTAASAEVAPALAAARLSLDELSFREAAESLAQTLREGRAEPGEVAALYLLWAEAEASMEHETDAVLLFARGLSLAPGLELPPRSPPKLRRSFEKARASLAGRVLQLEVSSAWLSDGRVRTRLELTGDAHHLAHRAQLRPQEDSGAVAFTELPHAEVTWACERPPCAYSVELLDAHGNTLRRAGGQGSALHVDRAAPLAQASAAPARGWARAWPWAVTSGVMAAASGVLGVQLARTQQALVEATSRRADYTYAQVLSLERARRPYQLGALGAGAVALAAGVGAAVVW